MTVVGVDTSLITTIIGGLGLRKGHFLLGGSGVLALREIRNARDLDIFVSRSEYARLQKDPRWMEFQDPRGVRLCALIEGVEVNVFNEWKHEGYFVDIGWHVEHPEYVRGVPCCALNYLLIWKVNGTREKDREDVRLIERYLASGGQ